MTASPADSLRIPPVLGRYQLREQLGRGGSASVHLGFDSELQRVVAIKVLHPQFFSSPTMLGMFQAEAKILALLDHPGIVAIYDVGSTPEGLHYIVSKF